jgi:ornithine carbamoyltransferase
VHGKHFVGVADLDGARLAAVLELAGRLKADARSGSQLGGRALYLSSGEIRLGEREDGVDAARVLSRMVDGIVARTYLHADVQMLARHATVPVINGLSDLEHPCQVLADLQTVRERTGGRRDVRMAYVGDGNNVAHSLMLAAPRIGVALRIATPPQYRPDSTLSARASEQAQQVGVELELLDDPVEAVRGADFVYTDTWFSMGQENEAEERRAAFVPYQVNDALLRAAGPRALVMHCLPAHRGEEITDDVLDGPRSIVYDQAENRVHAQKALLVELLGTNSQRLGLERQR